MTAGAIAKSEFLGGCYHDDVITKLLAGLKLKSAWLEEPELEEIFMHYYKED